MGAAFPGCLPLWPQVDIVVFFFQSCQGSFAVFWARWRMCAYHRLPACFAFANAGKDRREKRPRPNATSGFELELSGVRSPSVEQYGLGELQLASKRVRFLAFL